MVTIQFKVEGQFAIDPRDVTKIVVALSEATAATLSLLSILLSALL